MYEVLDRRVGVRSFSYSKLIIIRVIFSYG